MLFTFAIWILLKLQVVQSSSALQLKLFSPKSQMTQVPTSLAIWNLAFFFFFWQHWLTILPFFSITSGGFVLLLHTFLYTLQTTFFHLKHKLLFLSLLHSLPHTDKHTPPPHSLLLLHVCFLPFKLRSQPLCDISLWMSGFQPMCNVIKQSSSSLSVLYFSQSPGTTVSCLTIPIKQALCLSQTSLSKLSCQSVF